MKRMRQKIYLARNWKKKRKSSKPVNATRNTFAGRGISIGGTNAAGREG